MNQIKTTATQLLGPLNDVETKHAPEALYAAGQVDLLQTSARVAIVGSREASPDGIRRARKLATILAAEKVIVVSGLAKGIDTAAHTAALEAGGRTVAVIGTPLDVSYPKQNSALQKRLMEHELVLSQFPSGYPTKPQNFPMRNRVMALVSDATVIMEAGQTSGSISQGWEALRLGRALFIAQSIVENAALGWPAEMIGYGAQVLSMETVNDLLAMLPERGVPEAAGAFAF